MSLHLVTEPVLRISNAGGGLQVVVTNSLKLRVERRTLSFCPCSEGCTTGLTRASLPVSLHVHLSFQSSAQDHDRSGKNISHSSVCWIPFLHSPLPNPRPLPTSLSLALKRPGEAALGEMRTALSTRKREEHDALPLPFLYPPSVCHCGILDILWEFLSRSYIHSSWSSSSITSKSSRTIQGFCSICTSPNPLPCGMHVFSSVSPVSTS